MKALVSMSYLEPLNQTKCLQIKRFARLTGARSKKIETHVAMATRYTSRSNFAAINSALRISGHAARISRNGWSFDRPALAY